MYLCVNRPTINQALESIKQSVHPVPEAVSEKMSENSLIKNYENLVELNYQLYNGLFLTLPLDAVEQTGLLIPLLEETAQAGLDANKNPTEIINEFFKLHKPEFTEAERINFLFKVIQYVERQVVLVDALEDAAFDIIHQTDQRNTLRKLMERVDGDGLEKEFSEVLSNFASRVTLTAHPTQFYPGQVLAIITDLAETIKTNDIGSAKDLLQQLGNTPFFQQEKPSPYEEAVSLGWYLANTFYPAIGELADLLLPHLNEQSANSRQILSVGFWPGGDRDGNPFVDVKVTLQVAAKLRSLIISLYHSEIRDLKRRLSFKGIYERLEALEKSLLSELTAPGSSDLSSTKLLKELDAIDSILNSNYQGLFGKQLNSFRNKVKTFGYHFASLDIRQDSRVIKRTLDAVLENYRDTLPQGFSSLSDSEQITALFSCKENSIDPEQFEDAVIRDTLQSMRVIKQIQQSNGPAGCHRYIISNCRGAIDIARVMALFKLSGWDESSLSVDIVPLFETIDDLLNAGESMSSLYKISSYSDHLSRHNNQQTVMLGFSDGTKDGGYLMANWAIYSAKENITRISRDTGIEVAFFDGRGGPPARGGGSTYEFYAALGSQIESNQIQLTVQGQTISSYYGTVEAALHNLRQLLAAGLANNLYEEPERELDDDQRKLITGLAENSYKKYLALKNHELFVPYLEEMSTLKYYGQANIGSRPSSRGNGQHLMFEDLRAISFVGAWAQLKQNVPGFYGLGTALKKVEDAGGLESCQQLYQKSRFFRALVKNSMQSLKKSNFQLTSYMRNHDKYGKFWTMLHNEYELSVEMSIKISGQDTLLEDHPTNRLSIDLRQKIVLPLLIVQQYALMTVKDISFDDTERLETYEKMVMRSLFGNINASRNSA